MEATESMGSMSEDLLFVRLLQAQHPIKNKKIHFKKRVLFMAQK